MSPRRRLVFAVIAVVLAVAGVFLWRWWGSEPARADRAARAVADLDGVTAAAVSAEPVNTRLLRIDLDSGVSDADAIDAVADEACRMIDDELVDEAAVHRADVSIELHRTCQSHADALALLLSQVEPVPDASTVIRSGGIDVVAGPSAEGLSTITSARQALEQMLAVDTAVRLDLDLSQVRVEDQGSEPAASRIVLLRSPSAEMDAALEALVDVEPELGLIEIDGRLLTLRTAESSGADLDRLGRAAGVAAEALDRENGSYVIEVHGSDRRLTGQAGSDPSRATELSTALSGAGWDLQTVNADRTALLVTRDDPSGGVRLDLTGLSDTLTVVEPPVPEEARIEVVGTEQIFGGTPADLARVSRDREPLIEEGYGAAWATNTEQSPWDASVGIVMPEGQSLLAPGERRAAFEAARSLTWDGTAEVRIWEDAGEGSTRTRGVRIISTSTGPAEEISYPGDEEPIEEGTARDAWDETAGE